MYMKNMKSFSEFLIENPELIDITYNLDTVGHQPISNKTLKNQFDTLKTMRNGFSVVLSKDKETALLLLRKDENYSLPLVNLEFYDDTSDLAVNGNLLQVKWVSSTKGKEGRGLASLLYKTLIDNGYTVLSDFSQLIGGMKLWKRLIKISNNTSFYVYDYEDKSMTSYDGTNIPDSDIWKKNTKGQNKLLVMIKK